jgi:hypothetical protein
VSFTDLSSRQRHLSGLRAVSRLEEGRVFSPDRLGCHSSDPVVDGHLRCSSIRGCHVDDGVIGALLLRDEVREETVGAVHPRRPAGEWRTATANSWMTAKTKGGGRKKHSRSNVTTKALTYYLYLDDAVMMLL